MANILSLALKVNADASGVVKNLTPAERALGKLAGEAEKVTSVFDTFAKSSEAAAAAQRQAATDFGFLASYLKTGKIDAEQFADEYARLKTAAQETADAFARGVEVTRQYRSEEQQRADVVAELSRLLELRAISEETYARAVYQGSDAQKQAVAAERERLRLLGDGQRITQQFLTIEERRASQLAEVDRLLKSGAISDEIAARARAEFSGANEAALRAEQSRLEAEQARKTAAIEADRARIQAAKDAEAYIAGLSRQNLKEYEQAERQKREAAAETQRIIDEVNRANAKAEAEEFAQAERIRAQALAEAARIIQSNLTPQERYDQQIQELSGHLQEGRLTQEQYNRAAEKAQQELNGTAVAAGKTDKSIASLVTNTRILADIEIGRLIFDGLQAIGNVFSDVSNRITSLVSSVNGSVDALSDLSARTGIGVEKLQGYSFAAKLAGVDTEQFGAAVQKLGVNIGKAAPGDAFDKSLRGISLSVQELRALSPEQQFSAIGEAISQLPTATDRAAAAVEIFGQQGAALAPLFREGVSSLQELEAEGRKLGAIVSDVQVSNVADMNDAFDKVRVTVQGIVGQVLGNLAPAVTDVTNQFLEFVKTWEGTGSQGTGGTGIANAITDVLLQGAQYFAAVFDDFIARFDSLGLTLQDAGASFVSGANAFTFVSEGLRTVANVFELSGNALSAALGKILEALGSFVSDDLEQYGKELSRQAMIATKENSRQLEEAAANAGRAFAGIFTGDGGGTPQAAGEGAALDYLSALEAKIKNARLPEVQVQAGLGDAQERLSAYLKTAEDGGSAFFQQSVATVEQFQKMAAAGGLTADQIAIMNGFMDDLNNKLNQELANRKNIADAAAKQAEEDGKRIDALLKSSDAAAKIRDDLAAVEREQSRVSELLADPAATEAQISAAQERLRELEDLQDSLADKAQAASQGFSEGFDKAFDSTNSGLTSLIVKAEEFGPVGAAAAEQLRAGIELAQNQASGGILTKEAYDLEVERQKQFFDQRIEQVKKEAEERLKSQKEVEDILFASQYGYNSERIKAAENLNLLNQDIAETEERIAAARASGDQEELNALSQRLAALDQAAAREDDIASGRAKAREEEEKRIKKNQEDYYKEQQKAQESYAKEQEKIFEEQRKAAEAEAKRQEERLRKLNTLGPQSINVSDVRTTEGANLVVALAANAQDPALIQARLQTKYLERISGGIAQAAANYFNTPVAIVGYSKVGGIG